jgi:hypothetical protein
LSRFSSYGKSQAPQLKASGFHRPPPDLAQDAFQHISTRDTSEQLSTGIARIAKYGLRGTGMPGHEYLPDEQVTAITDYIVSQREYQRR